MANLMCYRLHPVDEVLSKILGWEPNIVTSIRGIFDGDKNFDSTTLLDKIYEDKTANIENEELKKFATTLQTYYSTVIRKNVEDIKSKSSNIADSYKEVKKSFSNEILNSRLDMISNIFSRVLDLLQKQYPNISRRDLCNGTKDNKGNFVGGQLHIFNNIFNQFLKIRQNCINNIAKAKKVLNENETELPEGTKYKLESLLAKTQHQLTEIDKVLLNWGALVTMAKKMYLKQSEGLKLGNKYEYASEADMENYGPNDMEELFDPEAHTREHWTEMKDLESTFGNLSSIVRKVISTIPLRDSNENLVKDDLDNPKHLNPVKVHQILQEIALTTNSSEELIIALENSTDSYPWIKDLLKVLNKRDDSGNLSREAEVLRTKFFVDLRTNFQPYSMIVQSIIDGVRELRTKVMNRVENITFNNFLTRMKLASVKEGEKKIYKNKDGKAIINWEVFDYLFENFKNAFPKTENLVDVNNLSPKFYLSSKMDENTRQNIITKRLNFVLDSLNKLGVDINFDVAKAIVTKTSDYTKVMTSLENIYNYVLKKYSNKEGRVEELSFSDVFKQSNQGSEEGVLEENIKKISLIVAKNDDALRMESRVLVKNTKGKNVSMSSNVYPSYLGDFLSLIKSYVSKGDMKGLKEFLSNKYLDCPYFYSGDVILSRWARDLYFSTEDEKDFASQFGYERLLGISNKESGIGDFINYENFVDLNQALSFMSHYFSFREQQGRDYNSIEYIDIKDYEEKLKNYEKGLKENSLDTSKIYFINRYRKDFVGKNNDEEQEAAFGYRNINGVWTKITRDDYGNFPVFTLGDSGACKFIKARRYSKQEIIDGLYDVYKQELIRKKLVIASLKKLNEKLNPDVIREDGTLDMSKVTVTIDSFSNKEDEFSLLTFLNEDYESADGEKGKYAKMLAESKTPSEELVKSIIEKYMQEAVSTFKTEITKLGVLEKEGENNYKYFNNIFKDGMEDVAIEDYYWNSKFATIQQLQLMTVDPSFYKNTKDLQKRYKELHAPGKLLDTSATWNGNKISNGIETCMYFDDISLNGEDIDNQYMKAIFSNFSIKSKEETQKAIDEGITIHRENEEEEKKRIKELQYYLGDNFRYYKAYMDNTLTDGQGYRTLDSYRKVLIMAGQWTTDMENAYNKIKTISDTYRVEDDKGNIKMNPIPDSVINEISKLAVVFQPIKPYMFTLENLSLNDTEKLKIPVQHKYAEAVLIPELLPEGSILQDMALFMETNVNTETEQAEPIDLIGSTKIVKVGCFGAADISKVQSREDLHRSLKTGYVHRLNYGDYRIQTNIPEHGNSSQLFGTQVRKLALAGINKLSDYSRYIGGKDKKVRLTKGDRGLTTLTGSNLISFYNSLIMANMIESFKDFSNATSTIGNLSDMLLQNTTNNNREPLDHLIAYSLTNGKFTMPLFEGALAHDSTSLIYSMFKKWVNKQTIKGGSAVQVSAMGIEGYEPTGDLFDVKDPDNPNNVIYAECEIPWDLNYTDNEGRTVELVYEDWCNKDGTLKLENKERGIKEVVLSKDDPRYKLCQSYKNEKGEVCLPAIEQAYPNILSIVAYRIPTERAYSMLNLRIKRFSPKIAGGTIKVPAQYTTKAGFDFDIDKLYFMRYEFKKHLKKAKPEYTKTQLNEIFAQVYKNNPGLKEALEEERTKDGYTDKDEKAPALHEYWKESPYALTYDKDVEFNKAAKQLGYITEEESYFEDYDFNKTPYENTRAARNNMLINIIQQRLMDAETFNQRHTPGGFAHASRAARVMRELVFGKKEELIKDGKVDFSSLYSKIDNKNSKDPEPNYDPSDPMTAIIYNQQNQVAGKLIGIFANQNSNHALTSLLKEFRLKAPISFAGHRYGARVLAPKENTNNAILNESSSFIIPPKGVDVDLNMAEFLAASVDAVKDPVLNYLNLNTITADAGAVLARIGYTTEEIGLLFNQPIIKEVCDLAIRENKSASMAIMEVINKYTKDSNARIENKRDANLADILSKNSLALNIINSEEANRNNKLFINPKVNNENLQNQLQILNLFQNILKTSTEVSRFVMSTKFTASNAVGSTAGDFYAQQMRTQNYIDSFRNPEDSTIAMTVSDFTDSDVLNLPISNANTFDVKSQDSVESFITSLLNNPIAYEQCMFTIYSKLSDIIKEYYPYETSVYKKIRTKMANLTKVSALDADTINSIHSDFLAYFFSSKFTNSPFNGNLACEFSKSGRTNREYYQDEFIKELYELRNSDPKLSVMPLFKFMEFTTNDEGVMSVRLQNVGSIDSTNKVDLMDNWESLLFMDKEGSTKYSDLATKLFMYNFYKTGFGFNHESFMHLAPTMVKERLKVTEDSSYVDILNNLLINGKYDVSENDFAKQYILNHLDNKAFVYRTRGKFFGNNKKSFGEAFSYTLKDGKVDRFTLDVNELTEDNEKEFNKLFLLPDKSIGEDAYAFRPCIIVNGDTYMCDSENFNISDGVMTYIKVEPLGKTNVSLQYNSIENNSKIEDDALDGSEKSSGELDSDAKVKTHNEQIKMQIEALKASFGNNITKEQQNILNNLEKSLSTTDAVEEAKKDAEINGVDVLDDKGNSTKACK